MLIPTSLTLNADWPLDLARVCYQTLSMYEDEVALWADLAGTTGYLYQAYDEVRCLPPAELNRSVLAVVAP